MGFLPGFQIRSGFFILTQSQPPGVDFTLTSNNNVLHLTDDVTVNQPINAAETETSKVALTTPNCTLSGTRSVLKTTVREILSDNLG